MPLEAALQAGGEAGLKAGRRRALSWRNRLVASPKFRQWAARFFLTRPVARRQTAALFDLCAGFVYSQILHACVSLKLFELLVERPRAAAELSRMLHVPLENMQVLLKAAAALQLVAARRDGRFGLGALGAAMVDNPGVAGMVAHHAMFYADLADPVALLRGAAGPTQLSRYWAYARAEAPEVAETDDVVAYTGLMASSQPLVAAEILDAYDMRRHRCLLDVGGGDGSFLRAAAARAPDLQLMLFDLPAVAGVARTRFEAAGLAGRVRLYGGSFRTDPLPTGADVISLVRVVHDHDDGTVRALLRAAYAALPPGGTLLLGEPMAETAGAERMGDAYFGLYLLAMGSGRPRSLATLKAMVGEAGFGRLRHVATHTPLLVSLLVAERG